MIAPELLAVPEFTQVGGKKPYPKKGTKGKKATKGKKSRKGRKGTRRRRSKKH